VVGPGREPQCAELALAFSCCVSYAGVEREPGVRLQAGLLDPLIDILTPGLGDLGVPGDRSEARVPQWR
jgi:hypothetical protein